MIEKEHLYVVPSSLLPNRDLAVVIYGSVTHIFAVD